MSTNISKQKRDKLIEEIAQIKDFIAQAKQDENTVNLLSYLGDLTREVNGKKYGLVFEEHREEIDEKLENALPVLNEEKDLAVQNGGEMNFLLEGDNLASLKLLEKTHKGRIDVIYIDPPYNTGAKNWTYNNDYVDKEDLFRHSKFCSFIKERIEIARNLLTDSGIIVCAIDDYEIASVRLIFDEIFGEDNRLGTVVVVHNPRGRNDDTFIATMHEYLLFYSKNSEKAEIGYFPLSEKEIASYKQNDGISDFNETSYIRTGNNSLRTERPGLWYEIYYNPKTNKLSLEKQSDDDILLLPINGKDEERCWRWGPQTFLEKKDTELFVKKVKGEYKIYKKRRITDLPGRKPKTVWTDSKYDASSNGIMLLQKIFNGKNLFSYPKSLYAVLDVLQITSNKSSTILDFFAGSGTTGHAVLKLNSEDGGHRKFILCTNNENEICRKITYERLKTVITGKRADGSKYSDGLKGSLKYFKVDFVPITEKLYYEFADELLLHVKELVELENALDFDSDKSVAIVLTDEEMKAFCGKIAGVSPTMTEAQCETLYMGHDVLLSSQQERLLKSRGITVNIVPEYYYSDLNA